MANPNLCIATSAPDRLLSTSGWVYTIWLPCGHSTMYVLYLEHHPLKPSVHTPPPSHSIKGPRRCIYRSQKPAQNKRRAGVYPPWTEIQHRGMDQTRNLPPHPATNHSRHERDESGRVEHGVHLFHLRFPGSSPCRGWYDLRHRTEVNLWRLFGCAF